MQKMIWNDMDKNMNIWNGNDLIHMLDFPGMFSARTGQWGINFPRTVRVAPSCQGFRFLTEGNAMAMRCAPQRSADGRR